MKALALAAVAAIPACTDLAPTHQQPAPIEVLFGDLAVTDTSFACTGRWPSRITPCQTPWDSVAAAAASVSDSGSLDIALFRNPIPIDGGASVVTIAFQLDETGAVIGADASEQSTAPVDLRPPESSAPIGGYVLPVAVSADATRRNAGLFEIDFAWGTIEGAYDTTTP